MSRLRLPSPSVVIALVALVAALGGSAAALPGKNKVKSDDIARGAVTGKQIKNNAVTGRKVKKDSLTGADVRESRLAEVPSAARAGAAGSLDAMRHFGPFDLGEGQQEVLFTAGPLAAVARCAHDGGLTALTVIAVSSEEGAQFAGDDARGVIREETLELDRTFERPGAADGPGGAPMQSDGFDDGFWMLAPGGTHVFGQVGSTADGQTRRCSVFGYVIVR